jgi:uncharacterized glyoxalase superfamily protein PhnB
MRENRSMPACTVIPVLGYDDVGQAVEWLCRAFGFALRIQIGNHRAQLGIGDGAVVVTERLSERPGVSPEVNDHGSTVMVRVDDVTGHRERASRCGVTIVQDLADYPFGERQYSCRDLGGHIWTFSQSIADVVPEDWGGTVHGGTGSNL